MATIIDDAARFRRALLALDQDAAQKLIRAYAQHRSLILAAWLALSDRINAAQHPDPAWLYQQQTYRELLDVMSREMGVYGVQAERIILGGIRSAAGLAVVANRAMAESAGLRASFGTIDRGAVEAIVGTVERSMGLIIPRMGMEAQRMASNALIQGAIRGQNPLVVGRAIRRATQLPLWQSHRIARTEMLRSYRETHREAWKGTTAQGWVWLAALDRRTCAVCWAMHGTEHDLSEPMGSHPQCRCTMVPQTIRTRQVFGPTGEERFARLAPADQRRILGVGRYFAYADGAPLSSLVRETHHPVWGPGRRIAPAREVGVTV